MPVPPPDPLFDNETAILRKYDRHFDTAISMMEALHQKKLEVDKLQDFLQQHDVQEVVAKMDELRDAQSKVDSLQASIRNEIPLAAGKIPEKRWENFKKLGYSKGAGAMSLATSSVKRHPSANAPANAPKKRKLLKPAGDK